MLFVLAKFEGQILDDNLATKIVGETIRYGLYRPMKRNNEIIQKWQSTPSGAFSEQILSNEEVNFMIKNNPQCHKEAGFAKGFPSRFATIYDLTKELGLAYFAPMSKIIISELGKHLLKAIHVEVLNNEIICEIVNPEYEQQVFLQALAKSQRNNPFVRVLNDNIPLILLLQTIKLLNADETQNGAGISRKEIPLLIFWKNNDATALYRRIVSLRKTFGYNPSDDVIMDICINEIMEGSYKKFDQKSIMVDYVDEFIRKMRITGVVSLRGAGRFIDINRNEEGKVEYIIKRYSNYEHFTDEYKYFTYIANLDQNLIQIKGEKISKLKAETFLFKWLEIYKWTQIKSELQILASNKSCKDNILKFISAPIRLEFLTALAIKSQFPEIKVVPNYSCDDEGLPTSTAGGNKGDIECFEHEKGVLIEVTMSGGRTQTMMEVWPIERHLIDFQRDKTAQCIFVAPTIFSDSFRQIKFIEQDSNGKREIRPYTISEFIDFLEITTTLYVKNYRLEAPQITIAAEN